MKKTKFTLAVTTSLLLAALTSCVGPSDNTSGANGGGSGSITLLPGYTSLENKNANGAIDSNGYYEYGGQKFRTKDTFNTYYASELSHSKLNYLTNTWNHNSEHYTNMVDGLVENDKYGNIVGALAEQYKVEENADGTESWYFKIREGVKWVKNDTGAEYAEVKADDFVASLEYVLDPFSASGTVTNVTSFIKNAAEYVKSFDKEGNTDMAFSEVGVEAVGDYIVKYTLSEPTPYFMTALTYSPFLPVNRKYLAEMGSDFGTNENNILVNGAFRMTAHEYESKIEYTKNESYYDKDHVYVNKVSKLYVPGTATPDTLRTWYESGKIDAFGVNAKDEIGYKYYVEGEDGTGSKKNPASELCNGVLGVGDTTYMGYYNFNRASYEYADPKDQKTDAQKIVTAAALLNKDFRLGVLYGMDVIANLKQYNKNEPYEYLARAYTNRELCSADNKDYVDYVCDVFNQKQNTQGVNLTGIEQGGDPIHNEEKASAHFASAKAALLAAGFTNSDFPIRLDVVGSRSAAVQPYEKALYQGIADASNGLVEIVYNIPNTDQQATNWGSEIANYDLSLWTGWGPDYADPNTYLHTVCIDGDIVENFGFAETELHTATAAALNKLGKSDVNTVAKLQNYVLGEYDAKYRTAAAIVDATKLVDRYKAFAEAEYDVIYESAIIIPWLQVNGYSASVSKTVAHQAGKASYGLTSSKLKNVVVTNDAITKAQRAAIDKAYEEGKTAK